MEIGIVGLPGSGKTTVFNALTGASVETATYRAGAGERHLAVVKVPDPRLDRLTEIFRPRKTMPAEVTYADFGGFGRNLGKSEGLEGRLLTEISRVDELLHVVRVFEDPTVPHPFETIGPRRDLEAMDLELAFSDLGIIERRLTKIEESVHKVRPPERELQAQERDVLLRLKAALEAGRPARAVELSEEHEKLIRHFAFLTAKPLLIVLNVGEDQLGEAEGLVTRARQEYTFPNTDVLAISGKLEEEIAQLPAEEVPEFLRELGIPEPGLNRVIRASYRLLGLISFLTAGPDEVRAWTIPAGTPAVKAAGAIHSDLERGFIRAEVVRYEDLVAAGSFEETRRRGQMRLEGRTYVVQDGDVLNVRFSV